MFVKLIPSVLVQYWSSAGIRASAIRSGEIQYVEGWAFNGEEWISHVWNRLNGKQFDLTYQIHLPHLLTAMATPAVGIAFIEVVGTLEDLEALGYSFAPGFAPLTEQRYRVGARNVIDSHNGNLPTAMEDN
ncbi:hypothetical protein [Nostoc sp.]|uniref:hypothetical protein n=1 Tax=Nostoc sp. TaxID=1180 RepID=UPI002FF49286